jgi:hypothetical protein
LKADENYFH